MTNRERFRQTYIAMLEAEIAKHPTMYAKKVVADVPGFVDRAIDEAPTMIQGPAFLATLKHLKIGKSGKAIRAYLTNPTSGN